MKMYDIQISMSHRRGECTVSHEGRTLFVIQGDKFEDLPYVLDSGADAPDEHIIEYICEEYDEVLDDMRIPCLANFRVHLAIELDLPLDYDKADLRAYVNDYLLERDNIFSGRIEISEDTVERVD